MSILSLEDKPDYFPEVEIEGKELERLILQVNSIAEGATGAKRSLSLTPYMEILPVNQAEDSVRLKYWPIADDPAIVVEARSGHGRKQRRRRSRRMYQGVTEWALLEPDSYIRDTQLISLNRGSLTFARDRSWGEFNELRVTYTAGFDMANDDDPDVKKLKGLLASILVSIDQGSIDPTSGQVILEEEMTKVNRVKYSNTSDNKIDGVMGFPGISPAIMAEFEHYRPYSRLI